MREGRKTSKREREKKNATNKRQQTMTKSVASTFQRNSDEIPLEEKSFFLLLAGGCIR
jgi:hypothetical protein